MNGGKTPMVVFGVRLDKLYKNRKLYGKLPKYCENLFLDDKKHKYFSFNKDIDYFINNNINNSFQISNSSNTKKFKKIQKRIIDNGNQSEKKIRNLNDNDVFIDFERNNFVDNINNTGKDYHLFKIKLRKYNPFNNKSNISSFNNIKSFSPAQINMNKTNLEKEMALRNLYLNNSPFKKQIKKYEDRHYLKKWDLPKAMTFDKISGRVPKKTKSVIKFDKIEGTRSYFPNYKSIFYDLSKNYVRYGKDKKAYFQNIKSGVTRKTICNSQKLSNNSGSNYSVINTIKEEKRKKKEEKIKRMKNMFGQLYEYIDSDKNINELRLKCYNKKI